jgi:uncharacterized protein
VKKINNKTLRINGITCHSCKTIIEDCLNKLNGIINIEVNIKERSVYIEYDENVIGIEKITSTIDSAGYKVINNENKVLPIIIFCLIATYFIVKNINLFSYIPNINETTSYGILFIIGLFTSLHCIAMCGGINISVCLSQCEGINNKFIPGVYYNLGRVTSYTIIGAIVGGIGSVISLSYSAKNMVPIVAGLFMIILGINMLGIFKQINLNIKLPKISKSLVNLRKNKPSSPYIIGLLNGFMPCGPLQTMQIYALGTGSFIIGGLSMLAFSLGTVPLMLSISMLSGVISKGAGVKLRKIGAMLIIILGLTMFNRGFDLTFLTKNINVINNSDAVIATIKDDYQEVTTRFERGHYKPIVVQLGIPVKWIIEAKGGDINTCNNEIYIKEYDITQSITFGENVIEFVPEKEGVFKYKCWMNMLASDIYVVKDISIIK